MTDQENLISVVFPENLIKPVPDFLLDGTFRVVEGDICDPKTCDELTKGVDTVFHTAAHAAEGQSVYIPVFNLRTNLLGSVTLLTAAINNNVENFVFTSSIASYGNPKELPVRETAPLMPEDPYGITKKAFEDYKALYRREDDVDAEIKLADFLMKGYAIVPGTCPEKPAYLCGLRASFEGYAKSLGFEHGNIISDIKSSFFGKALETINQCNLADTPFL